MSLVTGSSSGTSSAAAASIMRGDFPALSVLNKFGRNPDIDTSSDPEDIYGCLTVTDSLYTFAPAAETLYISSDNVGDNLSIDVEGLDSSWDEQAQTVTLAGQARTEIGSGLTWIRVNRALNDNGTALVGNVYIYSGTATLGVPDDPATIRAVIVQGRDQTEQAIFSVPNNKKCYITYRWASIKRGGDAGTVNADMVLMVREFGKALRVRSSYNISESNPDRRIYPFGEQFPAKSDILIRCEAISVNNSTISAGFDAILHDIS